MNDASAPEDPDGNRFDWRGYARTVGLTPMEAWLACQQAFRTGYPSGHAVTSPASLDRLCAERDMASVVQGTIADAAKAS